jgi:hypothetical protein
MSLNKYIVFMVLITIVCWLSWAVVLYNIDPFTAGFLGFIFFYSTLFFSLVTTFSVVGLLFRRLFVRYIEPAKQVITALRQGILLSFLVISSLILLSFDLLTWWDSALLVVFLAAVEFFFWSYQYKEKI